MTAGGYTRSHLWSDQQGNLIDQIGGGALTITPAALTLAGLTASNKVYDAMTSATVNTGAASYTGLIAGDNVVVNATGSFADKHAGTGKTVTLASSYNGADIGNYTITDQASTNADITPLAVTLTLPAVCKPYDGTTAYSAPASDLSALSGSLLGGDSVTVAAITYTDMNTGTNKIVTLDGVAVADGNGGANYIL